MKVVYNYVIKCNLTKIKCCSVKAMSSICRFMAVCQGSVGKIIIPPVLVLILPLLSFLGWSTPPPLAPPIRSKLIDVYCICSWTNHKQRKSLKIWFFYIIIYINNVTLYSLISFADTSKYTFILNKEIPNCSCSHAENIDFVEEEIHTCTSLNYHQTINVHLTRPDIIIRII